MTKDFDVPLVVSAAVLAKAGVESGAFPAHDVRVRGRGAPIRVSVVAEPARLSMAPGSPDQTAMQSDRARGG